MNITPDELMAIIYPEGIHADEVTKAFELHRRLLEREDGPKLVSGTVVRAKPRPAALVRTQSPAPVHKSRGGPTVQMKRDAFMAALKIGGTAQELGKQSGYGREYAATLVKQLRGKGIKISISNGVGNTPIYMLEE